MTQVSLSTTTNFDGLNALVESLGTILTLRLDLDEPAPQGGLRVFVDGDVEQIINRLDLPTFFFNPELVNISLNSFSTDFDNSGFAVTINEGATFGSFSIPIFDNTEPDTFLPETFDGLVEATFSVKTADEVSAEDGGDITGISDYTVDPNAATSVVLFADEESQLPDTGGNETPVVSFSTTPTVISEAEGTALVMEFEVDGVIPEGGITVNLEGDMAEILQQFLAPDGDGAVQTRVTAEGNILYRFDTSFGPGAGIVGGTLDVFSLEDGDPAEDNSNPEAAGTGFLSNFSFTITEPTASITLPVSDDILQEADQTFTYSLVAGEGYSVDETANSGTFTVTDGVTPATSPTVGVTATPATLLESEQTVFEVTFITTGDISAEGLVVQLQGPPRAIAEFDVNATNPRLPEDETVVEGVVVTGGSIVGTDEVAGSVFFRIFEPTATISVPVFQDDVLEGEETLIFNLKDGELYEVDPEASVINVTIDDRGIQGVLVEDNDSVSTNNDTIANAQVLDLTSENPNLFVEAEFKQRFEDRSNTVDATEDVDLYAVQLNAGDRITVDADSVLIDFDGFPSGPAPDLKIFNAAGEELVYSRQDGAPDEFFVAGRDGYLDFTAEETGTYYIGASQYRNDSYDPNQVGSGSGAIFSPRFGVLAGGEYTLSIALNPEGFNGEVFEEFTGTPEDGVPVVSFTTAPGTFGRGDVVVSDELIESEPDATGILDFTFTVEGEIPEGGLEVLVKSDTDFSNYFEGLSSNPRVAVGGEIIGGLYDADGGLIGFKALLSSNNARFPYNANSERDDDPTAPETVTFSLANSPNYAASETSSSSDVTFYDDLSQVPATGTVPQVGISFDKTELIESEGTEVTLTVTTTGDIPEDGLLVSIDSGARGFLGEFDVFNAQISGGTFPSPNGPASGFFFRIFENLATITLDVFDETTNDQIPPEDALEGVENFTVALQLTGDYTIDPGAASVDITILDNPDSVPIDDDGNGDGGGETDDVVTDNDGRNTIDDTLETAVETGLSPNKTEVTVEGSIDVRWRNSPEQRADNTEDVDMYSFELVADETVSIEASSVPFELDGTTQITAPILRVFNATGDELAIAETTFTDDVVNEPSLSFTASEDGTYYVGVSQYFNDNYDPLVNGSGDGVQLVDEGISPGAYNLDIQLTTDREPLPIVSFEVVPETISEEPTVENPQNLVEWKWTVTGDFPEEGIVVNLDTSGGGFAFAFTEQFAASPGAEFIDSDLIGFDENTGRLNILLSAPEASFKLYFANDIIEEGAQPFEFLLADGEGYIVDPDENGGIFTITDDNGGPGVGPTVGISASTTSLVEGDELTVNFTVQGEIPEGGVQVLVQSTVFGALGQFALADLGDLVLSGIEGFPEVGDGGGSSFLVTITEPTASITTTVFDDIVAEDTLELPFTIANGELYEVDPENSSITLTINDEPQPVGPTVGLTVDKSDVVEGDTITLTFNVEGEIPEQGVTVLVNDVISVGNGSRSLTEFEVFELQSTGIDGFPTPADGDSGFFVTITDPVATITLPVFEDGADEIEADEVFTFEVIDGEAYEVDPDASSITISISDPVVSELPEVSFTVTPDLVIEDEPDAAFTATFTVDGEVPEAIFDAEDNYVSGGLSVFLDVKEVEVLGNQFDTFIEDGLTFGPGIGEPGVFEFILFEETSSITVNIFDDIIEEEPFTFNFELLEDQEGLDYAVNPDASEGSFTLVDDFEPTVGISIDKTELFEGEEFTFSFDVDRLLPEETVTVLVASATPGALGEFLLFDGNGTPLFTTTGIEGVPTPADGIGSSFFATLTDTEASLTLSVFDDGPNEGLEEFTFSIINGEEYEVNPDGSDVTFTIDELPRVSISTTTPVVSEDGDRTITIVFEVEGEIPEGEQGLPVVIGGDLMTFFAPGLLEPTPLMFEPADGVIPIENRGSEVVIGLIGPMATASVTLFDDIIEEEPLELTFEVLEDEGYTIGEGSTTITINDGPSVIPGSGPEVGISSNKTELVEGEEDFTINFTVDGEIPVEGLQVLVSSGTPGAIGEFNIFDENNNFVIETTGLAGFPESADGLGSSFFATIIDPNASITLSVFDDGPGEGLEEFTLSLVNGEQYEVDPDAGDISFTIDELPQVSISITPDVVVEEDADAAFTATFTVDGEVPEAIFDAEDNYVSGGLSVFLDVKEVEVLGNQFDTFIEDGLTFGPGIGEPGVFEFILFEETSSITVNIFDDIIEEEPFTFNFELLEDQVGLDYAVNPDANMASFELVDGNGGSGVGPTVGISISDTQLTEGEQFTFNFTVDGEIPQGGVDVLVTSDVAGALGEFVLFDENGTPLFETEGIAGVPTPADGIGSSFFATLTDPNASITLSVFDDGPGEGLESFNFSLVNGEEYEVAPDAGDVSFTIDDTPPVVELPVFGTLDGEMFDAGVTPGFDGTDDIVFGGAGDDFIDTVAGNGGNRLYGQSGDDTFILGNNDRAFAGAGDDQLFFLGGNNFVRGGAGADSFWLANGEIPEAPNTITDFDLEADVLGIAGLGIGFDGLTITQENGDTLIATENDELAKLMGVNANSLSSSNFAFV